MAVNSRYQNPEDEMLDRLRRVETRLNRYLKANGFDTENATATWVPIGMDGYISIPNITISVKEVLAVIPEHEAGYIIPVRLGERIVMRVCKPKVD